MATAAEGVLHVLDGDATLPAFLAAGMRGEVVVWRDAMSEGPCPNALRTEADLELRARAMERDLGLPEGSYLPGLRETEARIRKAAEAGEEIVLWFDEDLFCRVNASRVAWIVPDGANLTNATGSHAERAPGRMREHLERRGPVATSLREAWDAYGAPDPGACFPLSSRLPWLRLHMERFPHSRDGLGVPERFALEALARGPTELAALFRATAEARPDGGLTDVSLRGLLARLEGPPAPLVRAETDPGGRERFEITPPGRDVLEGRADRIDLRGIDGWLGGVHLRSPGEVWRWDGERLIPPSERRGGEARR